ncbi:MAG: transposase [Pirellulales bacterium]
MYVFCGDQLLCAYLRPSNIDGAKHSRAITKLLVTAIRNRWPEVKITLRADSGFCRWRLMRWCDKHDVSYILGVAGNKILERRVLMKAERLPAGPNTRFVVTNLSGTPQSLYDDVYVQRGEMENRIKEQQLMLFADRTSCQDLFRRVVASLIDAPPVQPVPG